MSDEKPVYLDGKKLPFSRAQFLDLLKFIRAAIPKAFEDGERADDMRMLDQLEAELGKM